ncbi:site-specific integrase [Prolixibacteraceae bacterium Z1-6]|uniref:Site-specific integrase n=1 Tax=Draconibacterium aestuarii TaxID=2998507 RepID=A0A9X3F4E9_9BACT|nr:site-specific integrase [Prolixibacteraceae bacterium Z1-6]
MEYDLSILFYTKTSKKDKKGKAPIYCRITVNGGRAEISTNEKTEPDKWDRATQRMKGRSELVKTTNNHLDVIESKIKRLFNRSTEEDEEVSAEMLKDLMIGKRKKRYCLVKIFEENNELTKQQQGQKYSKSTVRQYGTTLKRLKEFLVEKYGKTDLEMDKLDINFIRRFEIFLRTKYKNGDNTAMKYLKQLKKVVHYAIDMGYLDKDPFRSYSTPFSEVNRGYLTADELIKIEEKKFRITRLDQVRDVFVFVCYTGLSYSDLKQLKAGSISKGINGKNWIIYEREKTGVRASIPLLPPAQAILDKYKDDPVCIADGILLPVKSNQKLNSYLSEIAELCEIDKHITMHLGRHTFATTVTLTNGVPIETVQKMLGHKNLSTTQIYSKVVDTKISEDMSKVEDRLKSQTG